MGFSNQERINLFTKSLAAAVYDANATAVWYESKLPFQFILDGEAVWTQVASIPPAGTLATARANALANPTIIQDLSQNVDAVRLTLVAGTNQSTYVAYEIYNDTASPRLGNWILPQLVPQTNGAASNGYAINLYNGDPNAGGVLVSTSAGTTGTGINKTVGWIFNYASGILILADDFKAAITDPWIVGFRYIGETANSTGSVTAEYVSNEYVADEALVVGDLVRVANSLDVGFTAGRVVLAGSTNTEGDIVLGIVTVGGNQGDVVSIATSGKVGCGFAVAPLSVDNGKKIYLSSTNGKATTIPPSTSGNVVCKVGILAGADGITTTPLVDIQIQEIMYID